MTKDNTTTNTSNEAESPAFLVGAVSGSSRDYTDVVFDEINENVIDRK